MKQHVLAVALIFLLMLGGCKKSPIEEQAFIDAVVQDPAPQEQPSVLQEGMSSVEEQPPEKEPSAEMTEEPAEEPKEEQKEENAPAVPMTVQQVAPLKGRIYTLSAEDQKVLEVLFERQEWGEVQPYV